MFPATIQGSRPDGGEMLHRAANAVAPRRLPGAGLRPFAVRHDFSGEWHRIKPAADRCGCRSGSVARVSRSRRATRRNQYQDTSEFPE
ncbi:MAG: hypothetical protein LC808_11740 [Actinobacteria bacterium]|nr:hypothetical protein [Actinomycetota bacterium]